MTNGELRLILYYEWAKGYLVESLDITTTRLVFYLK